MEKRERNAKLDCIPCKKSKKTQKKTMKTIVFLVALSLSHAMNSDSWVRSTHVYNLKEKHSKTKILKKTGIPHDEISRHLRTFVFSAQKSAVSHHIINIHRYRNLQDTH